VISASRPSSRSLIGCSLRQPSPRERGEGKRAKRGKLDRSHASGAALRERRSWLDGRRWLDLLRRARQRPIPLVRAHLIVTIVLRRVAIDHLTIVERVGAAADLMLDREKELARVEADNVLPTILVLIAFLGDQSAFFELIMRARELLGIDLQMMAIEFR